jgi:hypothetical protein
MALTLLPLLVNSPGKRLVILGVRDRRRPSLAAAARS